MAEIFRFRMESLPNPPSTSDFYTKTERFGDCPVNRGSLLGIWPDPARRGKAWGHLRSSSGRMS